MQFRRQHQIGEKHAQDCILAEKILKKHKLWSSSPHYQLLCNSQKNRNEFFIEAVLFFRDKSKSTVTKQDIVAKYKEVIRNSFTMQTRLSESMTMLRKELNQVKEIQKKLVDIEGCLISARRPILEKELKMPQLSDMEKLRRELEYKKLIVREQQLDKNYERYGEKRFALEEKEEQLLVQQRALKIQYALLHLDSINQLSTEVLSVLLSSSNPYEAEKFAEEINKLAEKQAIGEEIEVKLSPPPLLQSVVQPLLLLPLQPQAL